MKIFFNEEKAMLKKVFLLIVGVVLGAAAGIIRERYSPSAALLFLVFNVFAIVMAYIYLHLYYKDKLKKTVKFAVESVESVKTGATVKESDIPTKEAALIHNAINELKMNLGYRESSRNELLNMINSAAPNMELNQLLDALLPKIMQVSQSSWGAFYLANNATGKLEIKSSVGFSQNIYSEFDISIGEGIIGKVAADSKLKIIKDIPDDTIYITQSFLGRIKPKNLMIVPIIGQERLLGVMCLASLYEYTPEQVEITENARYYLGATIGNSVIFERTKRLTGELQFQNKLIQDLNNELELQMNDKTSFIEDIVDSIKDYAIYGIDREGIIISWNKGAEKLLGYTAKEVVGKFVDTIYNDEELMQRYYKRLDEVTKSGRYEEQCWRKKKDGTSYYADVHIFARVDRNGLLAGYTNLIKDITELKNMQDTLAMEKEFSNKVMMDSPQAIIQTDDSGIVRFANGSALKLIGGGDIIGFKFYSLFKESDELETFITAKFSSIYKTFKSIYNDNKIDIIVVGKYTLVYIALKLSK